MNSTTAKQTTKKPTKKTDRTTAKINKLLKQRAQLEMEMFQLLQRRHDTITKEIENQIKKQQLKQQKG